MSITLYTKLIEEIKIYRKIGIFIISLSRTTGKLFWFSIYFLLITLVFSMIDYTLFHWIDMTNNTAVNSIFNVF